MTNPSHTELAALAKSCGAVSYTNRASPHEAAIAFSPSAWEKFAAALESPERVQGEAVRTQLEWFALAAHWYINASDRELAEQGQARGDALKQVHLLSGHLEASGFKFATPSPQAEKQPLSEADEALMRDALRTAYLLHSISYMYRGIQVSWSDKHEDALKQADQSIEALRKRLESSK